MFAFVSYRMAEQDHKIASMLGLISTMAEELQFFRSKLINVQSNNVKPHETYNVDKPQIHSYTAGSNKELIDVSDDESDDSEEEAESDDSEQEESDDSEQEDSDDSDDEVSVHYDIMNNDPDNLDIDTLDILNDSTMIKTIHLEEPINILNDNLENIDTSELDMNDPINLNSNEDLKSDFDKTDYKKMSINKLREIVVEKGLPINPAKLKKQELIKLIEDA
jgi:hypothetical protein